MGKNRQKSINRESKKHLGIDEFFVAAFGIVALAVFATWSFTGSPSRTETSDKLTYLGACVSALLFGLYALKKRLSSGILEGLYLLAWIFASIGIFIVEHKEMSKEHPMGFGPGVALLTLATLPLVYSFFERRKLTKLALVIVWLIAIFIIVSVGLAFFQTDTTLLESGHSEYIINEIWGPASGYNTYQEFIPQYVYLIGWLFKPVLTSLGAIHGTQWLVLTLTIFGYVCLGLMIWMSKKAWPNLPWPILLVLLLPFSTPTPGWSRISFIGPASTLLSGPALRILGGLLVGASVIFSLDRISREKSKPYLVTFPGVVSALVIWNNLDFGLAAFIASFVLVTVSSVIHQKVGRRVVIFFVLSHVLGHILTLAFLKANDAVPNWSYFGWFVRQFGGGFGSITIEIPGPVLVSPPLMFATASLGIYVLLRWGKMPEEFGTAENYRSAMTATFFGLFCIFALPYYVNRSYHAGQMSILYIPLGIALIASLGLISNTKKSSSKISISRAFPAFVAAFMSATIFLIPNPLIEWKRINGGNPNGSFPRMPLQKVIEKMPEALTYAKNKNLTIGFFGEGGNYVHALNGFPSANIFNSPLDMFQSNAAVQLSCRILRERNFDLLLLTESAEQTFAWNDGSLCQGLYVKEIIPIIGVIGVRKG